MGVVLEIGVQLRKFVIISNRTCYRSVRNHPFLVAMLLFLIFLYKSFPVLFSILVSASPVLVCTAVLLGTLLSFGQPLIPEIEKEEKLTHNIASLKTGISGDDTVVVDRDVSFSTERFSGKTRDIVHTSLEEASYAECRVSNDVEDRDGLAVYVPLVKENFQPTQNAERMIEHVDREFDRPELENQRNSREDKLGIEGIEWDTEAVEQQYTLIQQVEDDISPRESFDAYKGDHFDSSLGGGGGNDEADEDVDDEASDSESDRAESSSPDASMADILPMLDELHPLLDSEAPEPAHMSHDESDAASDRSDRSNAASVESDKGTENRGGGVEEDGVDYNDGDEEEAHGGKENESESAIIWTEDDQKNLMDLGNLELERNQRLENLIARRRARKSFKITAEKNLIDFDSADLPFNIARISTTRHNPFDLSYDSFDNMGLPPIPGSAPSVMLPGRNPFDLPYESNEEKPDLKGDPFEREFMAFHSKDAFFRRHESFSLGPSTLGHAKQERQDFKWRPVFVPERLASEGTSRSSFQRQSSEVSDSKLSSVPDTDSVSSAADLDEREFSEQDFTKETEMISNISHATFLAEHGSQSAEDVESLEMEQAGKRDVQHDEFEIKLGELQNLELSLSTKDLATSVEHITNEIQLKPEPVEEENSSTSSLSSLLEMDEKISDVMEGGSTSLEARGDNMKEFVISPKPSVEESEVQFLSEMVDESEHKKPVYDSSPLPTEKILSLNSISSDLQTKISEMVTHSASAELHVPSVDQDSEVYSEVYGENTERGTSGYVEIGGTTSKVHASHEIERSLGMSNQLNLACTLSEEDMYLPNAKTASLNSNYQSLLSEEKPPSEQEKVLSWSDKSMVEPCFDDHVEALIIKEEVDDVKEIDAGLLSELDAVGDFSVNEVVGETLHTNEPVQEESNVSSAEFGDSNLSESTQELRFLGARSVEDIDMAFKQIHKGLDVEEVILPSMVDDQLEVEASESTVQTSSELPIVEARFLEDIFTGLKQASEGNVSELPQLLDPEDGSTELPLEYIHTVLEQVSEGNIVGEPPKPSYSDDGSEEVGTAAVGSTEEVATGNMLSSLKENTTALTDLQKFSERHVDELLKPTSNSRKGLEDIGIDAMGSNSVEEIMSSNVVSSAQESITTQTALTQVSEGHVDELPKSTSNSKEGLAEEGTDEQGCTDKIASSNTISSDKENISTQTALPQVSESHDELPKPTSNSEEGLEEVGASTKEIESSTIEPGVQETTTTTALKQVVSGSNVDELPKSSNSQDALAEV